MALRKVQKKGPVSVIEAERFLVPDTLSKAVIVFVLTASGNVVPVNHGDWILPEPGVPGRHYPVTDEQFQKLYGDADANAPVDVPMTPAQPQVVPKIPDQNAIAANEVGKQVASSAPAPDTPTGKTL